MIEEFEAYYLDDKNPIKSFDENLRVFTANWKKYCLAEWPMYIPENKVIPFLKTLKGYLGK